MDAERDDHDQRLKVLLKEFFEQFFWLFFPTWAKRLEFSEIVWLDKEFFVAPPRGKKRQLDLVARLRIREGVPPPSPDCDGLLVLVHIEVESGDSVKAFHPRMFEYYVELRRDSQLPVLPIALFLRVGLNGVGFDAYEEFFWDQRLLRFEYAYVGLPALEAEQYVHGAHLLGAALSSLMRVPAERRAEIHLEALKRIAVSGENDYRRYLLAECAETYTKLDDAQRSRLEALLESTAYQEVRPLMITTFERGKMEGKMEGRTEGRLEGKLEGLRETVLCQLETKFGPLTPDVVQRVAALNLDQLRRLSIDLLTPKSLVELGLQD